MTAAESREAGKRWGGRRSLMPAPDLVSRGSSCTVLTATAMSSTGVAAP